MELEVFKKLIKFPYIFTDKIFDSTILQQHRNCIKCKTIQCYKYFESHSEPQFRCDMGYDCFSLRLNSNLFVINGIILQSNNVVQKDRKKSRSKYVVKDEIITQEINWIKEIDSLINKQISANVEQNFSLFHDIKTTYNLVISSTQNYIHKQEGRRFEEKLENCPQEIIDLYDSLDLVNSQLGMIDIILNPQAILQGSKKSINIYRLFHKISQLFSNRFYNRIEKENKEIKWYVQDNKIVPDINCYDSIELVPIILIDNAIKYSLQNTKITIAYEVNEEIEITVTSYGPVVKDSNIERIFEKNVRGDNAAQFSNKGIGMGLWVANNILKHHGSKLFYNKVNENNGLGLNKFSFRLNIE